MRTSMLVLLGLLFWLAPAAADDAAQKRYEKAVAELARRRAARTRRYQARSRQARALTAKRPLDLVLRGGRRLEKCRILRVGPRELELDGGAGKQTVAWSRLTPASHVQAALVSLAPDDADGFVGLGKFCLMHARHDDAERAFRQAVAIRPALARRVPDVAAFRKPVTFSAGRVTRRGESIEVRYGFDSSEEAAAFTSEFEAEDIWQEQGALAFAVDLLVPAPRWTGWLRGAREVTFLPGKLPRGAFFWIQATFDVDGVERAAYLAVDSSFTRYAAGTGAPASLIDELADDVAEGRLATKKLARAARRLIVRAVKGRLELALGGSAVLKVPGALATLAFGGLSANPDHELALDALTFSGQLSQVRYRQILRERRVARLRGLFEGLDAEEPVHLPRLSARALATIPADRRALHRRLTAALGMYAKDPTDRARRRAERRLQAFARGQARSALSHFWRGWLKADQGEAYQALAEYRRAVALDPALVEARAALASELVELGRMAQAVAEAREAIARRPDNARARAALAMVAFSRRKDLRQALRAIDQLEVATILDPKNADLALKLRQCRQVVAGPPWPGGTPTPLFGKHYVLHSDLTHVERARMMTELERIRGVFAGFLPAGEQKVAVGQVLLFASRATYELASALIGGPISPDTDGHFERTFKSLYLYRSHDDTGTGKLANTLATLRHEAWHQYVGNLIPDLPIWVDEGLGEHFATVRFDGTRHRFGVEAERLKNMRSWLAAGERPMPFAEFMRCNDERFGDYDVAYAQAWSMIHLFCVHDPARYRPVLMRYLQRLREGAGREAAYADSFGKLDMAAVQKQWRQMLAKLE